MNSSRTVFQLFTLIFTFKQIKRLINASDFPFWNIFEIGAGGSQAVNIGWESAARVACWKRWCAGLLIFSRSCEREACLLPFAIINSHYVYDAGYFSWVLEITRNLALLVVVQNKVVIYGVCFNFGLQWNLKIILFGFGNWFNRNVSEKLKLSIRQTIHKHPPRIFTDSLRNCFLLHIKSDFQM